MGTLKRIAVAIPLGLTVGILSTVSTIGYLNSSYDIAVIPGSFALFVFVLTTAWVESE
jgi:hypothetical protein